MTQSDHQVTLVLQHSMWLLTSEIVLNAHLQYKRLIVQSSTIPQLLLTESNFNFSLVFLSRDRRGAAGGSCSSTCYTEPQDHSAAQIFQCHNGGLLGLNCSFCAHCKTSVNTNSDRWWYFSWLVPREFVSVWGSLAHSFLIKGTHYWVCVCGLCSGLHTHTCMHTL